MFPHNGIHAVHVQEAMTTLALYIHCSPSKCPLHWALRLERALNVILKEAVTGQHNSSGGKKLSSKVFSLWFELKHSFLQSALATM